MDFFLSLSFNRYCVYHWEKGYTKGGGGGDQKREREGGRGKERFLRYEYSVCIRF